MISAYILTTVKQTGNLQKTIDNMKQIKNLKSISIVSGAYDLMILTNVPDLHGLFEVTNMIQCNPEVIKTSTQVIEREILESLT